MNCLDCSNYIFGECSHGLLKSKDPNWFICSLFSRVNKLPYYCPPTIYLINGSKRHRIFVSLYLSNQLSISYE